MPEECSSGCLRHHPVTGQLSSLLPTILGWRRPGKIGSANTKPRDESRGGCVSINPRSCHSEPVTDVTGVGIRNLLAGNLRKSAGIMRFGNGLPRQSADWLAMTGFFDRLTPRRKSRGFLMPEKVSSGCLRHHPVTGQWVGRCLLPTKGQVGTLHNGRDALLRCTVDESACGDKRRSEGEPPYGAGALNRP